MSLPNLSGIIGHESGMSPDGRTFYSGNPAPGGQVAAVDITNPRQPRTLAVLPYASHGLSISDDGNRAYLTSIAPIGVRILDVSQINARVPNPKVREISFIGWAGTIPQIAHPVTIGGRSYLVEVDEYGALGNMTFLFGPVPGVARIIDITDETRPRVVSNIRLEVHQPENFAALRGDPGSANPAGGYAGHYCNVPRRAEPGIVACSMLSSGLRVFDIRDPLRPREVAYFNQPAAITPNLGLLAIPSSWAQSSPAFVPERCEIWYSDGRTGFYVVRLTNGACPFPGVAAAGPPRVPVSSAPVAQGPPVGQSPQGVTAVVVPPSSARPAAVVPPASRPAVSRPSTVRAARAATTAEVPAASPSAPAVSAAGQASGRDTGVWYGILALLAAGALLTTSAWAVRAHWAR